MDQNFDNIPENQETQPVPDTADENQQKGTDQQYTDPNSGAGQTYQGNYYYDTGAGQTYQQQQQQPYQQQYQPYQQPGYDHLSCVGVWKKWKREPQKLLSGLSDYLCSHFGDQYCFCDPVWRGGVFNSQLLLR